MMVNKNFLYSVSAFALAMQMCVNSPSVAMNDDDDDAFSFISVGSSSSSSSSSSSNGFSSLPTEAQGAWKLFFKKIKDAQIKIEEACKTIRKNSNYYKNPSEEQIYLYAI